MFIQVENSLTEVAVSWSKSTIETQEQEGQIRPWQLWKNIFEWNS